MPFEVLSEHHNVVRLAGVQRQARSVCLSSFNRVDLCIILKQLLALFFFSFFFLTMPYRLWAMGYGLWAMGYGLFSCVGDPRCACSSLPSLEEAALSRILCLAKASLVCLHPFDATLPLVPNHPGSYIPGSVHPNTILCIDILCFFALYYYVFPTPFHTSTMSHLSSTVL